jgi:hypothetical protein
MEITIDIPVDLVKHRGRELGIKIVYAWDWIVISEQVASPWHVTEQKDRGMQVRQLNGEESLWVLRRDFTVELGAPEDPQQYVNFPSSAKVPMLIQVVEEAKKAVSVAVVESA